MGDDVDPEDPRLDGHYHVDRDAEWYYVDDDLAGTIALGPATDSEPGDGWVLTRRSRIDDILLAVNGEVSSRWGYRLPAHGGNLRVRMLLVGTGRA
ncbi:hypothetical protein DJ68_02975 [Halorubrum sp. C3]|nr:hypothetical protein DJ68_02975 [Halorubrum sp. C3]